MVVMADGIKHSMIFAALIMHLLRKIPSPMAKPNLQRQCRGPLNRPTVLGAVNCARGSSS
jgi:hypothetical protein